MNMIDDIFKLMMSDSCSLADPNQLQEQMAKPFSIMMDGKKLIHIGNGIMGYGMFNDT